MAALKLWRAAQQKIPEIWPLVLPFLAREGALGKTDTLEAVLFDLQRDHSQLWIAHEDGELFGVAVTQLLFTPAMKICRIRGMAGDDRKQWLHLLDGLEDFARLEGCKLMRIEGRDGWSRLLPDYRKAYTVIEKDLANG